MWEMAGITGLDPLPRTCRELVWATTGKRRHDWQIASELWAPLANAINHPKSRPFVPQDVNPFDQDGKLKPKKEQIQRLSKEDSAAVLRALVR